MQIPFVGFQPVQTSEHMGVNFFLLSRNCLFENHHNKIGFLNYFPLNELMKIVFFYFDNSILRPLECSVFANWSRFPAGCSPSCRRNRSTSCSAQWSLRLEPRCSWRLLWHRFSKVRLFKILISSLYLWLSKFTLVPSHLHWIYFQICLSFRSGSLDGKILLVARSVICEESHSYHCFG